MTTLRSFIRSTATRSQHMDELYHWRIEKSRAHGGSDTRALRVGWGAGKLLKQHDDRLQVLHTINGDTLAAHG